mgnify:FL=1
MIKFDVLNRFSGAVQFTAEIEAGDGDASSLKLGLAVKWAVKNGASLNGANLNRADLYRANLNGANLNGANLNGADLNRANLDRASLNGADLNRANLNRANLDGANLNRANLNGADLNRANLNGASLDGASLNRANLDGANGINKWVKCIQVEAYPITYTSDVLQIGCQRHPIEEWADFDSRKIAEMDGSAALKFWAKYKGWIFQTIELCPAKPTRETVQ